MSSELKDYLKNTQKMEHVRGKPTTPANPRENRKVSQDNEKCSEIRSLYHPDELVEASNEFVENY